jgi:pyruvate-formate lyase
MTYIAMDAKDTMGLAQPALAVRIHNKTPKAFVSDREITAYQCWGLFFFNDNFYMQHLTSLGHPLKMLGIMRSKGA